MRKIINNAVYVSVVASLLTFTFTWLIFFQLMGYTNLEILYLSVLLPIISTFPTTIVMERQKKRLQASNNELKKAHHRLSLAHSAVQHKSQRDGLTGLFNRDYFFEITFKLQKRGVGGALLMIDADKFKDINDTYGHVAGDEALRLISDAIADSVRPDDFVGRVGGEEFAVFARDSSIENAEVVAERIRKTVESLTFMPTIMNTHKLTVSIGGARVSAEQDIVEAMKTADERLYQAKHEGRNRCIIGGQRLNLSVVRASAA